MKIKVFDSLPSTNDYIKNIKSPIKNDLAVQAKHQTFGKGRFGNVWKDSEGKDLLISVVIKSLKDTNKALMITTIALYNILNNKKLEPSVKLPNDLYVQSKKISGILIEQVYKKSMIIIGVGLNVNSDYFNDGYQATSLKSLTNITHDINHIRNELLTELKKYHELSMDNILKNYKSIVFSNTQTAYYQQKSVEVEDINEFFQCKLSNQTWIDCGALQFKKPLS